MSIYQETSDLSGKNVVKVGRRRAIRQRGPNACPGRDWRHSVFISLKYLKIPGECRLHKERMRFFIALLPLLLDQHYS